MQVSFKLLLLGSILLVGSSKLDKKILEATYKTDLQEAFEELPKHEQILLGQRVTEYAAENGFIKYNITYKNELEILRSGIKTIDSLSYAEKLLQETDSEYRVELKDILIFKDISYDKGQNRFKIPAKICKNLGYKMNWFSGILFFKKKNSNEILFSLPVTKSTYTIEFEERYYILVKDAVEFGYRIGIDTSNYSYIDELILAGRRGMHNETDVFINDTKGEAACQSFLLYSTLHSDYLRERLLNVIDENDYDIEFLFDAIGFLDKYGSNGIWYPSLKWYTIYQKNSPKNRNPSGCM